MATSEGMGEVRVAIASAISAEMWQGYSIAADGGFFVDAILAEIEAAGYRIVAADRLDRLEDFAGRHHDEYCGPWGGVPAGGGSWPRQEGLAVKRIRMVVSLDDGTTEEVTVRGEQAWLDQSNAWLKARRYDGRVCGVDAYAGKRLIGSWHAVESNLTPGEREEGRMAFMDDLTIKGVVG